MLKKLSRALLLRNHGNGCGSAALRSWGIKGLSSPLHLREHSCASPALLAGHLQTSLPAQKLDKYQLSWDNYCQEQYI